MVRITAFEDKWALAGKCLVWWPSVILSLLCSMLAHTRASSTFPTTAFLWASHSWLLHISFHSETAKRLSFWIWRSWGSWDGFFFFQFFSICHEKGCKAIFFLVSTPSYFFSQWIRKFNFLCIEVARAIFCILKESNMCYPFEAVTAKAGLLFNSMDH